MLKILVGGERLDIHGDPASLTIPFFFMVFAGFLAISVLGAYLHRRRLRRAFIVFTLITGTGLMLATPTFITYQIAYFSTPPWETIEVDGTIHSDRGLNLLLIPGAFVLFAA